MSLWRQLLVTFLPCIQRTYLVPLPGVRKESRRKRERCAQLVGEPGQAATNGFLSMGIGEASLDQERQDRSFGWSDAQHVLTRRNRRFLQPGPYASAS